MASSSRSEAWRAAALAGWLALAAHAAGAGEPPLELEGAGGQRVELAIGDGTIPLILHFWASWCPECAEELPQLEAAAERCAGAVRVAAVNVAESRAAAEAFRARHGLRLPLLRDPDGRLFRRFARGLPANVIWTRAGRQVLTGPQRRDQWEERLATLGCPDPK